jgi:peptidoglycan/xylan/chitin deacetylase (PgdA/CDA1 family)
VRLSLQYLARARARLPVPSGQATIVLGYHRVDSDGDDLAVTPAEFARQMSTLAATRHRRGVLELDAAAEHLRAGTGPRRSVVLTFDDAWADNHANALEPIVSHRLPATLYVPSHLLSTPGYMSPSQVREMAAAGVSIGAHTRTHPDLRRCDPAELEEEVRGSKEDLEDLLGHPVSAFAYPTGLYDARTVRAVESAGFTSAVTTHRGFWTRSSPVFEIPRSFVETGLSDATFEAAAAGGLSFLGPVDRALGAVGRHR